MQITVIPNLHSAETEALFSRVCAQLTASGATVVTATSAGGLPTAEEIAASLKGSAAVVAVGGDGTIVHVAKAAATVGCPVLGINGGHLGFLAGLEKDELSLLSALLSGEYTVEERTLLRLTLRTADGAREYRAMNEAVISRGALSQLVDLHILQEEREIFAYRGDGVILATPTGSTAYSLSAGGPVVSPQVDCLLMTPVCPHTVASRAQVLPADAVLRIEASALDGGEAFLTVDGEKNAALAAGDSVTVSRAPEVARLIRLKSATFYDVLNRKIYGKEGKNP